VSSAQDLLRNLEEIAENSAEKDKEYAVVNVGGQKRIIAYPKGSTAFDILSALPFDDGNRRVLKYKGQTLYGVLPSPKEYEITQYDLEISDIADDTKYTGEPKSVRAKILKDGFRKNASRPSYIGLEVDDKTLSVFAAHYGLKDIEELFSALNAGFISEESIEAFIKAQNEYVVEIQTNVDDGQAEDITPKIEEIIEQYYKGKVEIVEENPLEPNRFQTGVKVIFHGSEDEVEEFIKKIDDNLKVPLRQTDTRRLPYSRLPYGLALKGIIALGENVMDLFSGAIGLAQNALAGFFEENKVFYGDENLILISEAQDLKDEIKNYFDADGRFDGFDYDLVISENPDLILSPETYAFSTLEADAKSGKITLYVHKVFLEAMSNKGSKERKELFELLAAHEAREYLELLDKSESGDDFDIEAWHAKQYGNSEQKKLMDFAAEAAALAASAKQKEALAQEIAERLAVSESLSKDDPADILLLLGNDEPKTFDKAVELYKSQAVKKIAVLGGRGRLTQSLKQIIEKIMRSETAQARQTKDSLIEELFSPSQEDIDEYNRSMSEALDAKDINAQVIVGKTPYILKYFGFENDTLETTKYIIRKSMNADEEHTISAQTIKNLPSLVHNPLAVIKSYDNSLILVLNETDKNGRRITLVVRPEIRKDISGKIVKYFNFIPSMYGRQKFEEFVTKNLKENNILYIENKSPQTLIPLQLGSVSVDALNIPTKEDIVNNLIGSNNLMEVSDGASEAEIIGNYLISKGVKREDIIFEDSSTNTVENLKNIKESVLTLQKSLGRQIRTAFIQKPIQQLRAQASFNAVFEPEIRSGKVKGISVTVEDFYREQKADALAQDSFYELTRLLAYSLKGDALPSVWDESSIFGNVMPDDIWIKAAILLDEAANSKDIQKELIAIIENAKIDGKPLFPNKQALLDALKSKTAAGSFQYSAIEMFIDTIYKNSVPVSGVLSQTLETLKNSASLPFSRAPLFILKKLSLYARAPQYLKDLSQAFVFDVDKPDRELAAYLGSFASKSFALSFKENASELNGEIISAQVFVNGRYLRADIALNKTVTDKRIFNSLEFSVYGIDSSDAALLNEIKIQLVNLLTSNYALAAQLARFGLDLRGIKNIVYINDKGVNQSAAPEMKVVSVQNRQNYNSAFGAFADLQAGRFKSVEERAEIISAAAAAAGEMQKVEREIKSESVFSEKLSVSAMLKTENDSGIGELTALADYVSNVLKNAGVCGFTMTDAADLSNPLAANYLLVDLLSIKEAQGKITAQDLKTQDISAETVDKAAAAKNKLNAALKLYLSLSDKADIERYYSANKSWLDAFAGAEFEKYKDALSSDRQNFIMTIAMLEMFFERQIKETLSEIALGEVSLTLKNIDASNIGAAVRKWFVLGVNSLVLDIENIDEAVLKNLNAELNALRDEGYYGAIYIKSANQNQNALDLIIDYGHIPVIPFMSLKALTVPKNAYRLEIDDAALRSNPDIEALLKETSSSGARFVDYPIGLLWGERTSESALENYRVPAKGSKRFAGINFGLFKVPFKTAEQSRLDVYDDALNKGLNFNADASKFDVNAEFPLEVYGKKTPVVFAVLAFGAAARSGKISEIVNSADYHEFERYAIQILESLGTRGELKNAYEYLYAILTSYQNAVKSGDQDLQLVEAARAAGFLQGLSENLIIKKAGVFQSREIALIYAKLVSLQALLETGVYSKSVDGVFAQRVLGNINKILDEKNLKEAALEIVPLFKNLSSALDGGIFAFDFDGAGELFESAGDAEKTAKIYAALISVMTDVFIDVKFSKEDIRKNVSAVPLDAVKNILAAA
jgi:uncharacterized SAM-binding protein YcdF (DUF218 family)